MTTLRPAPDTPVRPTPRPRPVVVRPGDVAPPPRPTPRPRRPAGVYLIDPYEVRDRRTPDDERLDHLFEARCDWVTAHGRVGHLAVNADGSRVAYGELDARANRLARYLQGRGVRAGDRIGLLIDRPVDAYAALLGAFKIGAAYVPLDVELPAERLAGILDDARVGTVLSTSTAAERVSRIGLVIAGAAELVNLDRAAAQIDAQDPRRLTDTGRAGSDDRVAAVVYPDGGDEEPLTGVTIDHAGLCTVVSGAAEVYGLRPSDRAYQRQRLASLQAVEEIWVAWAAGATLVPAPVGVNGSDLRGPDLHAVLRDRRVTALRCDPELLASLGSDQAPDLRDLRLVLVSGGVCPDELVARWSRPGRRLVGGLRPAGATTTATWAELYPGGRPTVGVPLPGYRTVVLDVDDPYRTLAHGQIGEIGIAGVGLGTGPVPDEGLVVDVLGIPGNPSGWIHRTGDLGRVGLDGVIEYHGRAAGWTRPVDPPTVLISRVPPARTDSGDQPAPGATIGSPPTLRPVRRAKGTGPATDTERDLAVVLGEVLGDERVTVVGHFFDDLGADSMVMARFCARLRKRPDLPSASMKDIYRHPTIRSLATALAPGPAAEPTAPAPSAASPLEKPFREVLSAVLGVEQVAVDANFFDDLGADSMVMARFCARVRKQPGLPSVSMKDICRNPTLAALATSLEPAAPSSAASGPTSAVDTAPMSPATSSPATSSPATSSLAEVRTHEPVLEIPIGLADAATRPVGTAGYLLCGTLQLLFLLAYPSLNAVAILPGIEWIARAPGTVDVYLRSVVVGAAFFVALCTTPILLKWVLVGRWKPQRIRVWSAAYLRFWIVRTVVQRSPMALFVGSPLYPIYLRALGADIGSGVIILSRNVPVCTDLLTVGDGAVIRKDSFFTGYRAEAGVLRTGTVTIGRDAFVGEATVLDIATSLGDGAQLGHTSSLHSGQAVPAGERWHGSPARRTDVDYRTVLTARGGRMRRVVYSLAQLVNLLLVGLPMVVGGALLVLAQFPQVVALLDVPIALTSWAFYQYVLIGASALFWGAVLTSLLFVTTVPRVLHLAVRPDRTYPLYGAHYWVHRAIARTTNRRFLNHLFGDSSAIVGYLRGIGYDLSDVEQTGSNFGMDVKHENPFLSAVGTGSVVADGLSFANADYSSTSFRVARVAVGRRNFVGNNVVYPPQGRTGDDCLLATKVMVPIDGNVREGVGLLGSPSFEIPRSVQRDVGFGLGSAEELRHRLGAKTRHNVVTMALFLLVRWLYVVLVTLAFAVAADLYATWGTWVVVLANALILLLGVPYFVLVERTVRPLTALRPTGCSIYDGAFWRHERFWKVPLRFYQPTFNGTPMKTVIWRLLGVRMGRQVFDDGCSFVEKTFVTVGDHCTLNVGSIVQCHSQEDGAFKSDRTTLGAGVTLGVGAFVHYGVTVGDGAVLAPDSFLMKGEDVPAGAMWAGNPAIEIHASPDPGAAEPDAVHAVPAQAVPAEVPAIDLTAGAPADTDETTDHRDDRGAELATAGRGRTR